MNKETVIRDFYNRIIGYIREMPNGDKRVYDFHRKILGDYIKKTDLTKDFYGRVIGNGDLTMMLLNKK